MIAFNSQNPSIPLPLLIYILSNVKLKAYSYTVIKTDMQNIPLTFLIIIEQVVQATFLLHKKTQYRLVLGF